MGPASCGNAPLRRLHMIPGARVALVASLVLISPCCALSAPVTAEAHDVAVLRPGEGEADHPWDGTRMRGARERLKDMLPGRRE